MLPPPQQDLLTLPGCSEDLLTLPAGNLEGTVPWAVHAIGNACGSNVDEPAENWPCLILFLFRNQLCGMNFLAIGLLYRKNVLMTEMEGPST